MYNVLYILIPYWYNNYNFNSTTCKKLIIAFGIKSPKWHTYVAFYLVQGKKKSSTTVATDTKGISHFQIEKKPQTIAD